jgi:hypothetical protein
MENEIIERESIDFLMLIYAAMPQAQLQAWGMNRYKRFKTLAWKYIQTTTDAKHFVSKLFQYYPASVAISEVINFIDKCSNQRALFEYIRENLAILVGRMQYNIKHDREENKKNKEEESNDEI